MGVQSYQGYQSMVTEVVTALSDLIKACRHLEMEGKSKELQSLSDHLKNHIFSVGIMGEFKRGKSTVINALLGQDIVPADVVPCSATLNYIRWDTEKKAEIYFRDGSVTSVPVEELSSYVTKITEESEKNAENVDKAIVYYPCPFCQNGVQIVDTPGLNDDERMTEISENVIPKMDAIIMVITAQSPFSQSEAEFVRNKLMASDLGRIIFLVNKIDLTDEDERPRLIEHIKEKIRVSVMEKMEKVYGIDSKEYREAKSKVGELRLITVSAKKALKGKMNNKAELLEESGYKEFEEALSYLLTEERGLLDLIHPVNQLVIAGNEALHMTAMRIEALNMNAEKFESIQKEALEKLNKARESKKKEIDELKAKGKTLRQDMLPDFDQFYKDLNQHMKQFIAQIPISEADVANEETLNGLSDRVAAAVNGEMESELAIYTERMQHKVEERLGEDVSVLKDLEVEINAELRKIQLSVCSGQAEGGKPEDDAVKKAMEDAGLNSDAFLRGLCFPGLGAFFDGLKEDGEMGAIVGGLSGAIVGGLAGSVVFSGLLGVLGAGALLPTALIMSVAAAVSGKGVRTLIFGKKKDDAELMSGKERQIELVRSQFSMSVQESIKKIIEDGVLEKWFSEMSNKMYSMIADKMDAEWDSSLDSMEKSLTEIKVNLQLNEENRKTKQKELEEDAKEIAGLLKKIEPIQNRLKTALDQGMKEGA